MCAISTTTIGLSNDQGDFRFEMAMVARHLHVLVAIVQTVTDATISVRLSPFNLGLAEACGHLADDLSGAGVHCELWAEREHGRDYYQNVCFKVDVNLAGEVFELGDGGDVGWMQSLLESRKDRLVISGLGIERLALLLNEQAD